MTSVGAWSIVRSPFIGAPVTEGITMVDKNMTPEEVALGVYHNRVTSIEGLEYLRKASAQDIERFISQLPTNDYSIWFHRAKVSLDVRLAEQAANHANQLIKHTDTLTKQTDTLITESKGLSTLTVQIKWLTVVLAVLAFIQIVLMVFDIWKHK